MSHKIDFTTFTTQGVIQEIVGTTSGDNQNYCVKYTNGFMVAVIRKTFSGATFTSWGSCYEHLFSSGWLGNYAVAFTTPPAINYGVVGNGGCWIATDANSNTGSKTSAPNLEIVRPSTISSVAGAITLVAYGYWK